MKFLTSIPTIWLRFVAFVAILAMMVIVASQQVVASTPSDTSPDQLWQDIDKVTLESQVERMLQPDRYRVVKLDLAGLQAIAEQAPTEFTPEAADSQTIIDLPLPYGGYGRFRVVESSIMEPELAAKYPEFKTFTIRGVDDQTAVGRIDWTHFGFHAIILSSNGTIFIDPYSYADTEHYLVYSKADYTYQHGMYIAHEPFFADEQIQSLLPTIHREGLPMPVGDELFTYRLAVATTGEYTLFHGGTVADGLAAVVTAVNRVNSIYERDVAMRFILIANNDLIIYTNPDTDPYTNTSGSTMLIENQTNLDTVIGDANYDVGHVFSTGGGGIAFVGGPCTAGFKAQGVTGRGAPIGDPFYIDYVSHEMGHQFGASHSFNGTTGSCASNRHAFGAYEPGSGSSIMAYAGICGVQNLQPNSDALFHISSIEQIREFTVMGSGYDCAVITDTGNTPPIAEAGPSYTIPLNTPFILTGSASDADGDSLTYTWEQFNVGPAGHPNDPVGDAPIFRSFLPSTEPYRIFPQISDIVNNTQTIGEILPTYGRSLIFRFIARDNHVAPSAGGVSYDQTSVVVTDTAGPFLVTAPNSAVTWDGGDIETVSWDVANTDQPPISCTQVDFYLSSDGGYTYPHLVQANVPNTGSASITVPFISTTQARLQIICSDNIFFDISNVDFTINAPSIAILNINKTVTAVEPVTPGDTLTYTIAVENVGSVAANANVSDTFSDDLANPVCNATPGDLNANVTIAPATSASFECTAQVDSASTIDIDLAVDQGLVEPGTAVTYTITIANNNASDVTDATVSASDITGCTPSLGTPINLASGASQLYLCPNNIINDNVTVTATVTGDLEISNVASVSAPEAPNTPLDSNEVVSQASLSNSDSVTVSVTPVGGAFLSIDKTVTAVEPINPGDALTYTITVENSGVVAATTSVSDQFNPLLTNPVCNDVPGDLNQMVVINPSSSAQFECLTQVDASLNIDIHKSADHTIVEAGTAVTYTITITNNNAVTLTNVLVDDPDVVGCTPAVGNPISLAPGASETYVCPNNIVNQTTTNTAMVTAVVYVSNIATASAPEAPNSPVSSQLVNSQISLANSSSVTIVVLPAGSNYHIFLPTILRNN